MKKDTRARAHGYWRDILPRFGITPKQLSRTHQPCPMCGGTDRWRYSDHDGHGSYYCSGCGPGSGFDLVMKMMGWDFKKTAREIDAILKEGNLSNAPFQPEIDIEKRRKSLNAVWKGSEPLPAKGAGPYISSRGLMPLLTDARALFADIRYHPAMFLQNSSKKHPGLIALVRNPKGVPVTIHRTYFEPKLRKLMPPTEKINGSAIRLGRPSGGILVIGEGLETTLSGCEAYSAPAGLATISANGMKTLSIPSDYEYSEIVILSDNDRSFTGQLAAFELARRLDVKGKTVNVVMPSVKGYDFNDVQNKGYADILEWDNVRT